MKIIQKCSFFLQKFVGIHDINKTDQILNNILLLTFRNFYISENKMKINYSLTIICNL